MPSTPLHQQLDACYHLLLAFRLSYAAWQDLEAPVHVREVQRRLAGRKTLDELISALEEVLRDSSAPRRRA